MTNADAVPREIADSEPRSEVEILELTEVAELTECLDLQRSVWGASEAEVVPVSQLRAAQHAGGMVAGAWIEGKLVGFCYGFPSHRPQLHGSPGLHSHMTGVTAAARGQRVGSSLKWFQRAWCLERGLRWVEWTFDPLRAANARFNLEHLGASAGEYLLDAYGALEDALNTGLASDRLMAHWDLESPRVVALAAAQKGRSTPRTSQLTGGGAPAVAPAGTGPQLEAESVLAVGVDGGPTEPCLSSSATAVTVAIPGDLSVLLVHAPERARAWRQASRETFVHYTGRGYRAVGFTDGAYLLHDNTAV